MNDTEYLHDVYVTLEQENVSKSAIVRLVEEYKTGRMVNIKLLALENGMDYYTASEIIIKVLSLKKIEHPVTIVLKSGV